MKQRKSTVLPLILLLIAMLIPLTAFADTGPKPSVQITFENLGNTPCYGTLLSKKASTGPASAWDGETSSANPQNVDPAIWEAFVTYEDSDGFYYLQTSWQVNRTKTLNWGYYPPETFKILLYFPETDTFMVSGIYEAYAFDSYFTVDINEADGNLLKAVRSYDYTWEIFSFFLRVLITLALEIGIALLFGFRERKQLFMLILPVNALTQITLNLTLNVVDYRSGALSAMLLFFVLEALIFVAEALVYAIFMNRTGTKKRGVWLVFLYAIVANTVSLGAGLCLALLVPGIF